jgi:putative ABC transport system ATP-binding protein
MALLKAVGLENRFNHLPSMLSGGEGASPLPEASPTILRSCGRTTGNLDSKNAEIVLDLIVKIHRNTK